ncbi:MAG: YesL family protein [Bellilinea sp.]
MMKAVLLILCDSFQDVWADLWTMLACNLFWLVANVLIVPGPPATLALVYWGNRLASGEVVDLSDFWSAFGRYWGPAWRWGGINLCVITFLIVDIALTGQIAQGLWEPYLQGLYIVLLASWLTVQLFALPFLFEQKTTSVRQALHNGVVMIGKNLGFSIVLTLFLLLTLIVSTIAFMLSMMLGAMFIASASNRAVLNRLESHKLSSSRV